MVCRGLRFCFCVVLIGFSFNTALHSQIAPPQSSPAYKNTSLPVDQRVADLLKRMTLEEKATMLAGAGWMESAAIERLGIPAIKMADGPMGVRAWIGSSALTSSLANPMKVETTAFPSGIAMAASWDSDLVQREGKAIGQEVKALGRDMILARPSTSPRSTLGDAISKAMAKIPTCPGISRLPTSMASRAKASFPP